MSSAQPFAMYFQVQYSYACNGTHSQVADVLEVIQVAKQGLLLIGAIHREDDIWAALLLAKHLSWPVVADILSALDARWAQQQGKMSVVSAKFESSLFLSAYLQFSYYLELQKADICMAMNKEPSASIAHGLGTYHWLKEDITAEPLNIRRNPCSGFIEASVDNAGHLLGNVQVENKNNVLVFLHGFLGTGEDWIPIMKAISGSARCIAVDLPGLGRSKMQNHCIREAAQERSLSIEVVADILQKLIQNITPGKVTLVGYSMGARITLYMALRCASKAKDDSRACSLINHGIELFLDTWYAGALWNSLRDHPHFKQMVASRLQHDDAHTLAKVLSDSSIGRQL
ncbi:hypothetical protein LOK49_LG10G00528 [Camellia lanceoleosa]|uniref:Uncharacterized protein n=1 Tax=Camellia lanceoleosa TaxID=1840588 RepID=A0ACC0GC92_9ERIC|nr:hypothetical protein LOK49_LG10G00528 [Camellia lanceoleosa]